MDPIQRKTTSPITGVNSASEISATSGAAAPFSVGGTASPAAAGPAAPAASARMSELRSVIWAAAAKTSDRSVVLGEVVKDQIQRQFGADAPKGMTEHVTRQFEEDPTLKSLFNQLYFEAMKNPSA